MKNIFLLIIVLFFISNIGAQEEELTLEKIFLMPEFIPKGAGEITSMKDGIHYTKLEKDMSISVYEYETGKKTETLLNGDYFKRILGDDNAVIIDYKLSNDETKILLVTERKRIFRLSFTSTYFLWELKSQKKNPAVKIGSANYAELSPDGKHIALVRDENIYIFDTETGTEKQITFDGKKNEILNGRTDWVYEEELGLSKAFEWSPDGKKLAFLRFDERTVKEFSLTFYNDLYPEEFRYKYPKAGENSAIVTIHVYDLTSDKITKVDTGENTDQYIARIKWTNDKESLSFVRLNRLQNEFNLFYADASSGKSRLILTDRNKYYVNENYDIKYLKDGGFIRTTDTEGFTRIVKYGKDGSTQNTITNGNYDVIDIKYIDEEKEIIYYTSYEDSPLDKHLYKIDFNGINKIRMSDKSGTYSVNFGANGNYYVSNFTEANTPGYITIHRSDGSFVRLIEDNKELTEKAEKYNFVKKEFFSFRTSEGTELNGYIMKPADFSAEKKYPVLMYVYGGPGSQSVTNSWGYLDYVWNQYLCKKGYIVACVDGRGTAGRGSEFEKQIYRQMGNLETKDQIEGAKYLGSLSYVDKDRIGIWGWSFGGYMTCMCLTKGAEVFKTGVAVAPVTDFRYYDNIYTERYMGLPSENKEGYSENAPINFANELKGNLLLVHGSTDDNVHYQNTMEFANALIKANKQFEMQIYPNRNHSIGGGNTRYHLFKRITDYLLKNL